MLLDIMKHACSLQNKCVIIGTHSSSEEAPHGAPQPLVNTKHTRARGRATDPATRSVGRSQAFSNLKAQWLVCPSAPITCKTLCQVEFVSSSIFRCKSDFEELAWFSIDLPNYRICIAICANYELQLRYFVTYGVVTEKTVTWLLCYCCYSRVTTKATHIRE
jgi:hypothetical protein